MPFAFLCRTTFRKRVVHLGGAWALACIAACTGAVGHSPEAMEDDGGGGGGLGGKGTETPPPVSMPGVDLSCADVGIKPGVSPLRRLTNAQFNNSLRDLFQGLLAVKPTELPRETPVGGYDNNVLGQFAAPTLLEGYTNAAKTVASAASAKDLLPKVAPCAAGQDETGCGRVFLKSWASRIFRRPPESEELARLEALFKSSHASDGYAAAVADTLQAMLSSPQFLYLLEREGQGNGDVVKLTAYELASRLSYLLWDSIPDAGRRPKSSGCDGRHTRCGWQALVG